MMRKPTVRASDVVAEKVMKRPKPMHRITVPSHMMGRNWPLRWIQTPQTTPLRCGDRFGIPVLL